MRVWVPVVVSVEQPRVVVEFPFGWQFEGELLETPEGPVLAGAFEPGLFWRTFASFAFMFLASGCLLMVFEGAWAAAPLFVVFGCGMAWYFRTAHGSMHYRLHRAFSQCLKPPAA